MTENGVRYDYSPITDRPDWTWPDGSRLAVWVGVGIEDYRATGMTEDYIPDVPAPDLVNAAWRDYGNRVGAFRLLDRLAVLDLPPTVLLNTMVYDTAPDVLTAVRKHGAEVVGHGISNSDTLSGMTADDEQAYLAAVAQRIEAEEGERPGGWSSPWLAHTANTLDLLPENGFRYLLDLRLDDQPVWLRTSSTPVLAIPYPLELNDSSTMIGRSVAPQDFARMITDEFDELLAASAEQPLVMGIVVHSFISGTPSRLAALTRALRHLVERREDVWFTQPRHIYEAFAAACPAADPRSAVVTSPSGSEQTLRGAFS